VMALVFLRYRQLRTHTLVESNRERNLFSWEINSESSWLNWNLQKIWMYRDLLFRLVRRDFLIHHQQTLLGPVWLVVQPFLMLLIYVAIFDKAVGLSTDGVPAPLFYLSGIILWTLFSECFSGTAFTFTQNGQLFSKVYFPRLIIPLSIILGNYLRFSIQLFLFFGCILFLHPTYLIDSPWRWLTALVVAILTISGIGLGAGLIFSIITVKYRDLANAIHIIVRLLMFATPVIYPLAIVPDDVKQWITLNPLCAPFEWFRYGFFHQGTIGSSSMVYSVAIMVMLVVIGSMLFNKYANKLQDVI
jgi:lipopolysaccharide transport system permease protein